MHFTSRDFADTPECLDREFGDKSGGPVWVYGVKPVGFLVIRCNLGDEFIVRDPGGGYES